MSTGALAVRRLAVAVAAACAALVVAVPALAAAPANDAAATPSDIALRNLIGVRNAAFEVQRNGEIFNVDTSDATPSADDPVLRNDAEQSTCNTAPAQGGDTLFYRLRGVDGGVLQERTAITLDTFGSTYQTAIAVYEGAISQGTLIRCERGNLGTAAITDFITRPNMDYFIEVASVSGSGLLSLFVRAQDVQPPAVAVSAPNTLAEPGKTSTFRLGVQLNDIDKGSLVDPNRPVEWTVRYKPDGADEFPVEFTAAPGDSTQISVKWPDDGSGRRGTGTAVARVWDVAGNVGMSRLTLRVRDRTVPKVDRGYRVVSHKARKRVTLRAACSEPGWLTMQFANQSKNRRFLRTITIRLKRGHVVRSATWRNVRPDIYLASFRCRDAASNTSATQYAPFLFGF